MMPVTFCSLIGLTLATVALRFAVGLAIMWAIGLMCWAVSR